ASGGTTSLQQLHQCPDKADSLWFDLEWQRETLRWVAQQVRGEFEPASGSVTQAVFGTRRAASTGSFSKVVFSDRLEVSFKDSFQEISNGNTMARMRFDWCLAAYASSGAARFGGKIGQWNRSANREERSAANE
ncbi:MAG: hypothetical protein ACK56J_02070, partial [Planctomycetota bacterium]